ncbi:LLM class flavin-dependent oxidoreductase [Kineosporia succinea]|uniref:Alkanesulfonate monooxygenase SsuD/methylene tetrahydromethanopterin reductase-like flavin-dependent oxidoreductase (Luciferase family) n=1 Tax=Kineosporia succinea TaxID=84632 RepID=A0ABT9P8T1_9ACTN|nr:LLM class flavin-dependent oxidoreductase [Kineosporia succinea]MDP9829108.1 alkanesulfonate monooxygenase SsuD/methylene tetrahydromethanopterin reductase-like flavin-dependent oxidoreductase (luciferase family) [Kineosporia succinea]
MTDELHLGVALDGAGWHPGAWRRPQARPHDLFSPRYWADLVLEAERGHLDLVTFEDALNLQSDQLGAQDDRNDRVQGRLDAVLIAARVAPLTTGIGLVPTVIATHTEPFHISKAIATLDFAARGRAGVRVQLGLWPHAFRHFGRREVPAFDLSRIGEPDQQRLLAEYFDEGADYVEVVRRLWDSWEDDAEIRDVATGRFVDRDKLHYIDFEGRWFSVKGPSITPRPPQGQPLVTALGHQEIPYQLIARATDLGFVTPNSAAEAAATSSRIAELAAGRAVSVWADLVVVLDDTEQAARDRLANLNELAGVEYTSDAKIFAGTPAQLADLLQEWDLTGYRLRPAELPHDLTQITRGLVPELQRRGVFRTEYPSNPTLRGLLGLERPANRYTSA